MEAACDGDVFRPTNLVEDPVMLNIDSTAVVRNVAIFQHFLLNWKIWEKAEQGELEMLLATIDILVHGSHCYYEFNICLLYTSPSPRDLSTSRMPSSA